MKHRILSLLAGATLLAGAGVATAAPSAAAPRKPVDSYVFASKQTGKTLLVAYAAKPAAAGVRSATCSIHAKPTLKLPKPYYYSFPPQHFALPTAKRSYHWIGALTLPAQPATITIGHVWVTCS